MYTAIPKAFDPSAVSFRRSFAWEVVCYCFIFLAGLFGNLTVIIVVLKCGSARHRFREVPFNIYLMALAIVDLTVAVTCLPVYILSSSIYDHPGGIKAMYCVG